MSPHQTLPSPLIAQLEAYAISRNGFLPACAPLTRLEDEHYRLWEEIIADLPRLLETSEIKARIDMLPVLSTAFLKDEREWQRAFLILAIMAQGYIWSGQAPSERLPPSISRPLLAAASHVEMQPIASYAALNLWNWRPTRENPDLSDPNDTKSLITFTGTDDESWFFTISNAMEARSAPLLRTMLGAIEAVDRNDPEAVIYGLLYLQQSLLDIGNLLERMDERCNPQVFYHAIRPWLAGSMNDKLPRGVFYDEGEGQGSWRKYRGGSNGQSSLVQFLDAVLSVEHDKTAEFHKEMRSYMPGTHAKFLEDVAEAANIRAFVNSCRDNVSLTAAFDGAVASLSSFRDKHIQLVTRYIILPSRMPHQLQKLSQEDQSNVSARVAEHLPKELIGTGGTTLVPFLRQSRDETKATAVRNSA